MNFDALMNMMSMIFYVSIEDEAKHNAMEESILGDKLRALNYSRLDQPAAMVYLLPILTVEHIDYLSDAEHVATIHGTLVVMWIDKRLSWNATIYGGVTYIARPVMDMGMRRMPWIPDLHFTETNQGAKRSNVMQKDEKSELAFWNTGRVKLTMSYSVTTDCATEAGYFPRDYLNCSFTLYTPMNANRVQFTQLNGAIDQRKVGNDALVAGSHALESVSGDSLFLLGHRLAQNPNGLPLKFLRSVIHYTLVFRRVYPYYLSLIAAPLIAMSGITTAFSMMEPGTVSLRCLALTVLAQCFLVLAIRQQLPPTAVEQNPPAARCASVVLVQTFFVLALHALIFLQMQTKPNNITQHRNMILLLRMILIFYSIISTGYTMITIFDYNEPFANFFADSTDSISDSDYD